MISAKFIKSNGFYTEFYVSGHSGYAASGQDIVCSGVSSAVELAINIFERLNVKIYVNTDDKKALIECKLNNLSTDYIVFNSVTEVLKEHLQTIASTYPKNLEIV